MNATLTIIDKLATALGTVLVCMQHAPADMDDMLARKEEWVYFLLPGFEEELDATMLPCKETDVDGEVLAGLDALGIYDRKQQCVQAWNLEECE